MILGLGIDLLEISRVEQEVSRSEWLLSDGIFTPEEITYCGSAGKATLHLAACFAAKEAVLKALGVQVDDLAIFREVEVKVGSTGGYGIVLHSRLKAESERLGVRRISLSIAHKSGQTGAIAILEG